MDNFPAWANILITYLITAVVFNFIYLMDRRAKKEGPLFTQPPSPKSRLYALLVGFALGGTFFIARVLGFREDIELALLAAASVALIGYSLGLDRPLAQMQKGYAEVFGNNHFVKRKKIIGLDDISLDELRLEVQSGAKFVVFEYCISPLVVTIDYESNIYFYPAGDDIRAKGFLFSVISLLFGWTSIFGPFHVIRCVWINWRGGQDVTDSIMQWFNWRQAQILQAQQLEENSDEET